MVEVRKGEHICKQHVTHGHEWCHGWKISIEHTKNQSRATRIEESARQKPSWKGTQCEDGSAMRARDAKSMERSATATMKLSEYTRCRGGRDVCVVAMSRIVGALHLGGQ